MAIPKKGSRPIVVNGTTYRWYVRRKPTYSQCYNVWNGGTGCLTFCVEHGDTPACTLVVNLPCAHLGINAGSPILPVLPSLVAQQIERALADGWKATIPGSAFRVEGDSSTFSQQNRLSKILETLSPKVRRTIADLEDCEKIEMHHVAGAIK